MNGDFRTYLQGDPYQRYLYSYPHKTAYRAFPEPVDLKTLWKDEKKDALFLYLHIPFCRSKCAYCNLFSLSHPEGALVDAYLSALKREALALKGVLGPHHFSGYAIGGGTPSHLNPDQLNELFRILTHTLGMDIQTPGAMEVSPDTLSVEKLNLIKEKGIARLSIGIQSFVPAEAKRMGRNQDPDVLDALLEKVLSLKFDVFNLDLIYGIPGQTVESWLSSLERAVKYSPTEIFLYPLYTRPHTGLFKNPPEKALDIRLELYEIGRDFLLSRGYRQDSMRLFQKTGKTGLDTGDYTCQEDGMIGLGANARSYTTHLHYASPYSDTAPGVAGLIRKYSAKTAHDFSYAHHGIALTLADRKCRYLIKSLLKVQGLSMTQYQRLFSTNLLEDFPEIQVLEDLGFAQVTGDVVCLTGSGLARSDLIGPWFISPEIQKRMEEYEFP